MGIVVEVEVGVGGARCESGQRLRVGVVRSSPRIVEGAAECLLLVALQAEAAPR
jgi:hypothetical protein